MEHSFSPLLRGGAGGGAHMENFLSISNIEYLKFEIGRTGLTLSHLKDDLIDHVCCDVELEMQNGLPFEKAYEMVKQKFGAEGLIRIQHETLYLIDKNYRTMKKTMKIFGVIAPIVLSLGALFKIEHWPGAGILMVLGFFLLSFVFLPSAIYVNYKEVSNRTKKWLHFTGFLGTFLLSVSFLFKIMHWPGAAIAMTLGVALVCLVFLPITLYHKVRDKELIIPKYIVKTAILGLIIYILGFMCKFMHWPGAAILYITGAVLLVLVAFPMYIKSTYAEKNHIQNSFIFIVLTLIWFVVPTTLLTINVSSSSIVGIENTMKTLNADASILLEKNNSYYENAKVDERILLIKNQRQSLLDEIQNLKSEMGHAGENFEKGMVLTTSLKNNLQQFEMLLCSIVPKDKQLIINFLNFNFEPQKEMIVPASVEKLTFLQLNILLAESKALNSL